MQTADERLTRPPVISRTAPQTINIYRIGAALAQAGSLLTTYAFFRAVMAGSDLPLVIVISACVEFVLFLGKKLLFSARQRQNGKQIAIPSIALDTLLNAGGLWPYVKNIAASPPRDYARRSACAP